MLTVTKAPSISKELLDKLELVFTEIDIDPKTDINTIMYRAGQKSVVTYIKKYLTSTALYGDPDEIG